jgi:primosomal protein N' (replication factor Y)
LKYIIENDFVKFYNEEIEERKMFHYPPFFKLIKIQIKHKEEPVALNFSKNFAIILQKSFHYRVLGPTNPLIHKIQNYYIQEILIKFEDNINLLNAKNIILKNAEFLKSQKNYSGIFITYNVDAI